MSKTQCYGLKRCYSHNIFLWFIYTTAEPPGQQITQAIKFKSPSAGNLSSPKRQVHWQLLQPLRLWRFPSRPAAQAGAFFVFLLHVLLTYGSNKLPATRRSTFNQSQPRSSSSYLTLPFSRLFIYFLAISKNLLTVLLSPLFKFSILETLAGD